MGAFVISLGTVPPTMIGSIKPSSSWSATAQLIYDVGIPIVEFVHIAGVCPVVIQFIQGTPSRAITSFLSSMPLRLNALLP